MNEHKINFSAADGLLSPRAVDAAVTLDEVAEEFARNVRRRREAIGVSQHVVASILRNYGLTTWRQTTLAKVEAGQRAVKLKEAFALASLYEIPLDDLLRDHGVEDLDKDAVIAIGARLMRRLHPAVWAGPSVRADQ